MSCGMECGIIDANVHWGFVGTPPAFSTSTVRTGARSMRFNTTSAIMGISTSFSLYSNNDHHVGRFYIYIVSHPSPTDFAIAGYGSIPVTGPSVRLVSGDVGERKIYAAIGSTLGATGVNVNLNQWYRIDYDFNVNIAGADFCDVQVDGVACGQATGTGVSGHSNNDLLGALAAVTADLYIDDFVCSATAADYPIGPGYGAPFIPTADGAHNIAGAADFKRGAAGTDITNSTTNAHLLVGKVPLPAAVVTDDYINAIAPPNATDYVECVFGPAGALIAPTTPPQAVDVIVAYHQAATQSGNIRLALNDNGTTDDVLNLTAAGQTTLRYARKQYAAGPAGAWVIGGGGNGDFNDIRMRFLSSDPAPDQYWDAAMIEADFPLGTLLPNQLLAVDTTTEVTDNVRDTMPDNYAVQDTVSATASTNVKSTYSSQSADGETPQRQAVAESQGGESVGITNISPGAQVNASVEVTGAGTNVELTGTES